MVTVHIMVNKFTELSQLELTHTQGDPGDLRLSGEQGELETLLQKGALGAS